jgi:hypothetical protein
MAQRRDVGLKQIEEEQGGDGGDVLSPWLDGYDARRSDVEIAYLSVMLVPRSTPC